MILLVIPVPPVVGVFPMSKDGNYTLEYGRSARIQCISTTAGYITFIKTNKTGVFISGKIRDLENRAQLNVRLSQLVDFSSILY